MNDIRKIKQLQTQLNNLQTDADSLKNEIAIKKKEHSLKRQEIDKIQSEIKRLDSNGKIKISEHAILRYLERVKGIDIDKIENEILSESILKMVDTLGGNGVFPSDGFALRLKNNTVITIIT